MGKKIQLQIADPCHENWDKMSKAEKGRFCSSCQKQVVDFTNMSDSQLAAFFKKPSGGSVCGRFYMDQLDRTIDIPKKRIPWVKYFFQFALPAFLISMKATAQGKVKIRPVAATTSVADCNRLLGLVAPVEKRITVGKPKFTPPQKQDDLTYIKGIVSDENNNPVYYASVVIKGSKIGVVADSTGAFRIEKPLHQKNIVLQVSSVGYETKEIQINKETDLAEHLLIRLNAQIMGEVVVVAYTTVMGKIAMGGVTSVRKEENKSNASIIKSPSDAAATIKVYPNPVRRNYVFNLEMKNKQDEMMQLAVVDLNGSIVFLQSQKINKGLNKLSVTVDSRWAAGPYIVQLVNEKGSVIKTEKLVVQ